VSAVTLREVNKHNFRKIFRLRVQPEQEQFVASNTQSIAEAHFSDEAWFRAIYADDEPVGFVMLSLAPEKAEYFLWRFMIDAKHQVCGYGRKSLELVIDYQPASKCHSALHKSRRRRGKPG
jgi:diamine N-acetyltransferase